jgi:hypothetical protein
VYEYEHGELHLLSPGSTSANAYFAEASPNGENVFLLTSELLDDNNGDIGLFDARVGGGFPEAPEPAPCGEGDCATPAPAPAALATPASATFTNSGNLSSPPPTVVKPAVKKKTVKCPRGKKRNKHGRCVKKKQPRKSA